MVSDAFKWAVQALAIPAEQQIALFPAFVCKGDDMVIEWDLRLSQLDLDQLSSLQQDAIAQLDEYLVRISRGGPEFSEELWFEDSALRACPQWVEVRRLAQEILKAFGWPVESPPEDPGDRGSFYASES